MSAMKTIEYSACALLAWACALAGCGGNVGYVLRPIPLDQELDETVVRTDPGWVTAKVALVDLDGLILNQRSSPLFGSGENPVSLFLEKLDKAERDRAVKAVVIRINSPGGTVQATEVMYERIQRLRNDSGKPVIACITDLGASGGYYVACAAERIIAQPSSITGSIGVMIQTVSLAGTMKMLGIRSDAITSGPMKDMGSPLKDLTREQREIFQGMVDEFHDRFVEVVAAGRGKLTPQQVRALADGRVYTGRQAQRLGLVDELGSLDDAVRQAKAAAGVQTARVVMYHRPLGYRANTYSLGLWPPVTQINLLNVRNADLLFLRRPSFLYLWSTDLRPGRAG